MAGKCRCQEKLAPGNIEDYCEAADKWATSSSLRSLPKMAASTKICWRGSQTQENQLVQEVNSSGSAVF
ncbi:unnamed protein product [Pleuronectes platessa]|uniref:Uncharacterized protein n=1 Tax=Pleuronectes platessa TaxID=8262 RepID=A0A9N7VWE2_PLEPL|nr:unnamed protein product [Pleuronectes platessa]